MPLSTDWNGNFTCDELQTAAHGLIEPVLVGPHHKIETTATKAGLSKMTSRADSPDARVASAALALIAAHAARQDPICQAQLGR